MIQGSMSPNMIRQSPSPTIRRFGKISGIQKRTATIPFFQVAQFKVILQY